jgi:hypothetical protein
MKAQEEEATRNKLPPKPLVFADLGHEDSSNEACEGQ